MSLSLSPSLPLSLPPSPPRPHSVSAAPQDCDGMTPMDIACAKQCDGSAWHMCDQGNSCHLTLQQSPLRVRTSQELILSVVSCVFIHKCLCLCVCVCVFVSVCVCVSFTHHALARLPTIRLRSRRRLSRRSRAAGMCLCWQTTMAMPRLWGSPSRPT